MADDEVPPVRIFTWVMPRTISTALCKCLSSVDGMEIWFGLFTYASFVRKMYKQQTGNEIPMEYAGNEEPIREAIKIFESYIGTELVPKRVVYSNVKENLEASASKYIFAREGYMAFPDEKSRKYIPLGFKHVFLIRDPYMLLASYRKALYEHLANVGVRTGDPVDEQEFDMEYDDPVTNTNEFYSRCLEFFKYVRENLDPSPIVINTDDLLANPARVLKKFCHLTGLPYSDSLLQWDASPDVTKMWKTPGNNLARMSIAFYETAVFSGEFLQPKPAPPIEDLSPDVRRLADASMPYFRILNQLKI